MTTMMGYLDRLLDGIADTPEKRLCYLEAIKTRTGNQPFSPTELVARVKSHIYIHNLLSSTEEEEQQETEITYRNLTILPKSRRVYLDKKEVILVNKEFELLLFLAENPNLVFSKDTLFDRVWGMDSLGDAATVTVHINRLRDKLGKNDSKNQFIETVWGAGYRFRID